MIFYEEILKAINVLNQYDDYRYDEEVVTPIIKRIIITGGGCMFVAESEVNSEFTGLNQNGDAVFDRHIQHKHWWNVYGLTYPTWNAIPENTQAMLTSNSKGHYNI